MGLRIKPGKEKRRLFSPVLIFLFGAALGVASKLLDIYTSNFGNIFSQMSIWILLGTLIAIFSKTKGKAAFSVCSPVFAILTWMTKEKGALGKIISFGILVVTLAVSMVVFDGPRVYDIVIMLVLAYFLLIHKVQR